MSRKNENTLKADNADKILKKYCTPILVEYGDIRELTKSAAGKTGNDGATAGNSKTA
jgi:hypothetical protein